MKLVFPGRNERGDPELVEILREEIAAAGGWIPFERFMAQCLQHPSRGYYRRGRTRAGHGGDFLTAPEAHPAFGGAVARQLRALGDSLGASRRPVWIEAGAGTGTLSVQVAAALGTSATLVAIDTADHVHRAEGSTPPCRVRADCLPFADASITGGIYANELLDAFPVRRARRTADGWRELGVSLAGATFAWSERTPSAELADALARAEKRGGLAAEGQVVEVAPGVAGWIADAARVLARGFILLFDYGDDTPALWAPHRTDGTLRCFAGHAVHADPFSFVGTQDLTAHVDFGEVVAAARDAGLDSVAFVDQRTWLDDWGAGSARDGLIDRADAGDMRHDEAEVNVHAIDFLRDPRGLGRVRVLALAKGVSPQPIPGLTGSVPISLRFRADDIPLTRLPDPFGDLYE